MAQDAATAKDQSNVKIEKTKEENIRCAVANITDAVGTIVSHSTNDEFRQKCFALMQVSSTSGLVSSLSSQLNSIASQHMGVTLSAESSAKECSQSSDDKPVATNSQSATSSQCGLQYVPPSQSVGADDAGLDDDFSEFSGLDFIDDKDVITGTWNSSQLFQDEVKSATTSSVESLKAFKVLKSKTMLEDDWFDEVLDSDPFFNES